MADPLRVRFFFILQPRQFLEIWHEPGLYQNILQVPGWEISVLSVAGKCRQQCLLRQREA